MVACDSGTRGDGLGLNVREFAFEAQGPRVDAPSQWQTLAVAIEQYWHEPGIRNVLLHQAGLQPRMRHGFRSPEQAA